MTTTTLVEMEFALARIDLMIGLLKRQVEQGRAAEDIARYQEWRDDLDVGHSRSQLFALASSPLGRSETKPQSLWRATPSAGKSRSHIGV